MKTRFDPWELISLTTGWLLHHHFKKRNTIWTREIMTFLEDYEPAIFIRYAVADITMHSELFIEEKNNGRRKEKEINI